MKRKILAGFLLTLSSGLLAVSLVAIGLIWLNQETLTQVAITRLRGIDMELSQAQFALKDAKAEIERTLRIVEAAEKTLSTLKENLAQAKILFSEVDSTLGNQLVPVLQNSRAQINKAVGALKEARAALQRVNTLPFVNFNLPGDELLTNMINSASALETQISGMETLAQKAATFMKDASYLMGGDLTETKQNLQKFLLVITEYETKLTDWRAQVAGLITSLPGWVNRTAVILTIFLLWFSFSQLGLQVHGLNLWRGGDPLAGLRQTAEDEVQI